MKKLFFNPVAAALIYLLAACNSNTTADKTNTAEQTTTSAPTEVLLKCIDKGTNDVGNPTNVVVLLVDGTETIIDTTLACNPIGKTDYAQHKIPAEAVSACGGWWAGGGDYYYAVVKDGAVSVFTGWVEEGQTDEGYHWQEWKKQ